MNIPGNIRELDSNRFNNISVFLNLLSTLTLSQDNSVFSKITLNLFPRILGVVPAEEESICKDNIGKVWRTIPMSVPVACSMSS